MNLALLAEIPAFAGSKVIVPSKGINALREGLTHCFFLKDGCALPDQMPFVLTFPWRRFVLAVRDRHRAYQNEIASFVFS